MKYKLLLMMLSVGVCSFAADSDYEDMDDNSVSSYDPGYYTEHENTQIGFALSSIASTLQQQVEEDLLEIYQLQNQKIALEEDTEKEELPGTSLDDDELSHVSNSDSDTDGENRVEDNNENTDSANQKNSEKTIDSRSE